MALCIYIRNARISLWEQCQLFKVENNTGITRTNASYLRMDNNFDPMSPLGESESVRDIYRKLHKQNKTKDKTRSSSFANHETSAAVRSSDFAVPGGFRRQFVQKQPETKLSRNTSPVSSTTFTPSNHWLALWSDASLLSDVQALSTTDSDFLLSPSFDQRSAMIAQLSNDLNLPLLNQPQGDSKKRNLDRVLAGNTRTIFTIIKSFLGTAILFIPRGMYSAGK